MIDSIKNTIIKDFQKKGGLDFDTIVFNSEKQSSSNYIKEKNKVVIIIDELFKVANQYDIDFCTLNGTLRVYNTKYWQEFGDSVAIPFLKEIAIYSGLNHLDAKHYEFSQKLLQQLKHHNIVTHNYLNENIKINLNNLAIEIDGQIVKTRPPIKKDYFTYQLDYIYSPKAKSELFNTYLGTVLPSKELQDVCAEIFGRVFINNKTLKIEKVGLLYGSGANGKSVLYEIILALFGKENVSNYTLSNLTDDKGQYRAQIEGKLLNFCSEINGKLSSDIFKALASGEEVEVRQNYCEPRVITNYAKLCFNCNVLPKEVEHTNGFYRRFIIIPFDITIPPQSQDKQLAEKIIQNELSGVFNWVLDGAKRLLSNKGEFTKCLEVEEMKETFKRESNNVLTYLDEKGYKPSMDKTIALVDLYTFYKNWCLESGYRPKNQKNFKKDLEANGYYCERRSVGNVVLICE